MDIAIELLRNKCLRDVDINVIAEMLRLLLSKGLPEVEASTNSIESTYEDSDRPTQPESDRNTDDARYKTKPAFQKASTGKSILVFMHLRMDNPLRGVC